MSMEDMIIHLFCIIDDELADIKRHDQALLHPSETITIGVIYVLKSGGYHAFYRWLSKSDHTIKSERKASPIIAG